MRSIVANIPIIAITLLLVTGCEAEKEVTPVKMQTSSYIINDMYFELGVLHIETDKEAFVFDYYADAVFPRGQQYEVLYMGEKKIINIPTTEYDNFITLFEEQRELFLQSENQN